VNRGPHVIDGGSLKSSADHRAATVQDDPTTAAKIVLSDQAKRPERTRDRGRLRDGLVTVDSALPVEHESAEFVEPDEREQHGAPSRVLVGASAPSQDRAKGASRLLLRTVRHAASVLVIEGLPDTTSVSND